MTITPDPTTRLAETGARVTGPRRAVLDAVGGFGGPFTIEELCTAAPTVGRATVFRTVKLLQETGKKPLAQARIEALMPHQARMFASDRTALLALR